MKNFVINMHRANDFIVIFEWSHIHKPSAGFDDEVLLPEIGNQFIENAIDKNLAFWSTV
jgi:hypothetical protein